MFTTPLATLKLVLLNCARPFWAVLASSIVIAEPDVSALLKVRAPLIADEPVVVPVIDETLLPLVKQVGQVSCPVVALSTNGPLAPTAIVPAWSGI